MPSRQRRLPSCTVSGLLIVAFASLIWLLITQTVADADLWGHLRFGLDMLQTHRLPKWDTYSFTADRMWVNHEWLAELVMAVAYSLAGSLGLNLLKVFAIATIAGIVLAVARAEKAPFSHGAMLSILVVLTTYTRTQVIRPQLLSVTVFCVLLYALREAERQRYRALIAVPVCFAIWVNLHGAWIVGLACFACWLAAAVWTTPGKRGILCAAGVGAAAATLLNPYGVDMWRFLFQTVHPARPDITDWKPLVQLPVAIITLDLLLPLIATCAIVVQRQRVAVRHLAMIGFLAFGTWRVGRVDAFLEAAVGILLAPQILRGMKALAVRLHAPVWRAEVPFGRATASAAAAAALVAGLLQLTTIELSGAWLPDATSVATVKQACAARNVLTWFDWGEYGIWHLSDAGIRVSMDGRRETVYSDAVLDEHWALYLNQDRALDYPDRIAAGCVWLPTRLGAVSALQARGWTVAARTETSVVLRRTGDPLPPFPQPAPALAARRFPGP